MTLVATSPRLSVFEKELAFTRTYQDHLHDPAPLREVACLQTQFRDIFSPIRSNDLLAGRIDQYRLVGFGLEMASGGPGYYCHADRLRQRADELGCDEHERAVIEEMIAFWEVEATIDGKLVHSLPVEVLRATTNNVADMGGRLAGPLLDFHKLVQRGIPGLWAEVEKAAAHNGDSPLYQGMRQALLLLTETCRRYAAEARLQAQTATADRRAELNLIAVDLDAIIARPPQTLHQAAQLAWLYALISGVVNYGRMDVYLGDFLAADLQAGRITEAEALRLLQSWWQMIADRKIVFNSRVIVGGLGRPNEANADRFALLAMEATRTVIEIEPQLTLRFHRGQNPALMAKALDVIAEGRTYPMLYNDDLNVPAVENAFGVSRAEAERYLPYGCGEYALDGISFGSPNCSLNLLKALEVTLHNGVDALTGEPLGLALGDFESFDTFADLFAAYKQQVEFFVANLARRHKYEYAAEDESAAFLFCSMLYEDCIGRGKSLVGGGVKYRGGIIESMGMVNAGDSLASIKELVYERGLLTRQQLLTALDANFVGYERERRLLLNAPKYGNDDDRADSLVQAVSDHVAAACIAQAPVVGLDYFLVVNINNHANVGLGKVTAASADGRRSGDPLANGNNPTAGMDRNGVTAFLNSISKLDPTCHAGYVHNMRFDRGMFTRERPKLEALLNAYFARGGTQAMITVVNRGDLEAALREPEKYRNLIVRVGGFSARFVELASDVQQDVLRRTTY